MSKKGKNSKWIKDADNRIVNKKWLRYSSNIARRILASIRDKQDRGIDMNQKKLASNVGVTPQYISKVVKGKENLSLETIAKLSEALGIELITFPAYRHSGPQNIRSITRVLELSPSQVYNLDHENFSQLESIFINSLGIKVPDNIKRESDIRTSEYYLINQSPISQV